MEVVMPACLELAGDASSVSLDDRHFHSPFTPYTECLLKGIQHG